MQIHAAYCGTESKNLASLHARNETSGEEILVFVNQKEKTLSTNYFNLKEGANSILFLREPEKGKEQPEKQWPRTILITREPD